MTTQMSADSEPAEPAIDFAILTAIQAERKAVCAAFGLGNEHRVKKAGRWYWRGKLDFPGGHSCEIVIAQPVDMGNVEAALLASDVVRHWSPRAALLVGIAASADPDKVKLGDVVVGKSVWYYEHAKITPGGIKPQPEMILADAALLQHFTGMVDWDGVVPELRPDTPDGTSKVHQGVIASGEKVIADAAVRDEIASGHRKILAIEMEGYGFSRAMWQSFEQVRHLDIRAICDDGTPAKNDNWHKYAAAAAASFARHFLTDAKGSPHSPTTSRRVKLLTWVSLAAICGGVISLAFVYLLYSRSGSHAGPPVDEVPCDQLPAESEVGIPGSSITMKILVADFANIVPGTQTFGDVVANQIGSELVRFKEEYLADPSIFDIKVPVQDIAISRIRCNVSSHSEGRALAEKHNAAVVIWGKIDRAARYDSAGAGHKRRPTGYTSNPVTDAAYTVQPSATLRHGSLEGRVSDPAFTISNIGSLDLPALMNTRPLSLVNFAIGIYFYEQRNPWLAARFFEHAAQDLVPGSTNEETVYYYLARSYYSYPNYEKSLKYGLSAYERIRGTATIKEAEFANMVARAYDRLGDKVHAKLFYQQAVDISKKTTGIEDPSYLNNLGAFLLEAEGNIPAAIFLCKKAIANASTLGSLGFEHAHAHGNVAAIYYFGSGDQQNAIFHAKKAVEIIRGASDWYEGDIVLIFNLAGMLLEINDDDSATLAHKLTDRAYTYARDRFGPGHPDTMLVMWVLASSLLRTGDVAGGLQLAEKAFVMTREQLGANSLKLADNIKVLSKWAFIAGRYNEVVMFADATYQNCTAAGLGESLAALHLLQSKSFALEHLKQSKESLKIKQMIFAICNSSSIHKDAELCTDIKQFLDVLALAKRSGWKDDHSSGGAVVRGCKERSQCQQIGLKPGDWIITYDKQRIRDAYHLVEMTMKAPSSQNVVLMLNRAGQILRVNGHGGHLGVFVW